jgi:general secretion pathway protein N
LFEFPNSVIEAPQSWRLLSAADLCDRLGDGASKRSLYFVIDGGNAVQCRDSAPLNDCCCSVVLPRMLPTPLTTAQRKKPATMRKSRLLVPVAALLTGVLAAGAGAQETGRELPPSVVLAGQEALRAGHPLWAIPLSELSQTRARPLFSPSRRPSAPPGVAALATPAAVVPPPKREADHPRLTLLGTIVSESLAIGVFIDEASHEVVRLKAGEAHDGWTLHAVAGRTAVFEKDRDHAATLVLPAPEVNKPVSGDVPAYSFAPPVIPAATKGGVRRPPREG